VIDPDECIDCTLCVPRVSGGGDLRRGRRNRRISEPLPRSSAELAKIWKPIIAIRPALPDADEWARVKDKLDQLQR
jgi:ferredoxin